MVGYINCPTSIFLKKYVRKVGMTTTTTNKAALHDTIQYGYHIVAILTLFRIQIQGLRSQTLLPINLYFFLDFLYIILQNIPTVASPQARIYGYIMKQTRLFYQYKLSCTELPSFFILKGLFSSPSTQ